MPKLIASDTPLFGNLLTAVFPTSKLLSPRMVRLRKAIKDLCLEKYVENGPCLVLFVADVVTVVVQQTGVFASVGTSRSKSARSRYLAGCFSWQSTWLSLLRFTGTTSWCDHGGPAGYGQVYRMEDIVRGLSLRGDSCVVCAF